MKNHSDPVNEKSFVELLFVVVFNVFDLVGLLD
jgi:hypothetical protein